MNEQQLALHQLGDEVMRLLADYHLARNEVQGGEDWYWLRICSQDWPKTKRGIPIIWFEIKNCSDEDSGRIWQMLVLLSSHTRGFLKNNGVLITDVQVRQGFKGFHDFCSRNRLPHEVQLLRYQGKEDVAPTSVEIFTAM